MVRASARSAEGQWFDPGRVIPKDVKRWYLLFPCLSLSIKRGMTRTGGLGVSIMCLNGVSMFITCGMVFQWASTINTSSSVCRNGQKPKATVKTPNTTTSAAHQCCSNSGAPAGTDQPNVITVV